MIRNLLLDLDDTIFDFKQSEAAAIARTFHALQLPLSPQIISRYSQINDIMWGRYNAGKMTRDRVLLERFEQLFAELEIPADAAVVEATYRHELGVGHYFVPGAQEALAYLGGKYTLYLASNGVAETQFSRLEEAGITGCFRDIFISETAGAHKPEPAYFDYCFSHMADFTKESCMIIGDNLHSDIAGGIAAGIYTCWFNYRQLPPDPAIRPDHVIDRWEQISALL